MYEEFPTNESLLEYIREDKSHEVGTPKTQEKSTRRKTRKQMKKRSSNEEIMEDSLFPTHLHHFGHKLSIWTPI